MTERHLHDSDEGLPRLQKVMAAAGVASRRASEVIIQAGRVSVNGQVVRTLGTKVDPQHDRISVDGHRIHVDEQKRYYALNKPAGVVSTMHDEQGRPDLSRYVNRATGRIYNVGRLDEETHGLLLLTNDGEMAHRLMHPSFEVEKRYLAQVDGAVKPAVLAKLREGIDLEDGFIKADSVRQLDHTSDRALIEVRLHSGRNRVVRRMLAEVGHPVRDLVRTDFGPIKLANLPAGGMRPLTTLEIGHLLEAIDSPN